MYSFLKPPILRCFIKATRLNSHNYVQFITILIGLRRFGLRELVIGQKYEDQKCRRCILYFNAIFGWNSQYHGMPLHR